MAVTPPRLQWLPGRARNPSDGDYRRKRVGRRRGRSRLTDTQDEANASCAPPGYVTTLPGVGAQRRRSRDDDPAGALDVLRLAPLLGVASVVVIAAGFAAAGNTPAPDAPTGDLIAFYTTHTTGQLASGALLSLGALLFLAFASQLGAALRPAGGPPNAPLVLCLAGAILVAVGLTIFAGLALALGDAAKQLDRSSLQTVHVLSQELVFPLSVGTSAFLLGSGIATVQTRVLPRWTAWLALACGAVAAAPSHILGGVLDHIGFFGFVGLGVWTLIVSLQLTRRPLEGT